MCRLRLLRRNPSTPIQGIRPIYSITHHHHHRRHDSPNNKIRDGTLVFLVSEAQTKTKQHKTRATAPPVPLFHTPDDEDKEGNVETVMGKGLKMKKMKEPRRRSVLEQKPTRSKRNNVPFGEETRCRCRLSQNIGCTLLCKTVLTRREDCSTSQPCDR